MANKTIYLKKPTKEDKIFRFDSEELRLHSLSLLYCDPVSVYLKAIKLKHSLSNCAYCRDSINRNKLLWGEECI